MHPAPINRRTDGRTALTRENTSGTSAHQVFQFYDLFLTHANENITPVKTLDTVELTEVERLTSERFTSRPGFHC